MNLLVCVHFVLLVLPRGVPLVRNYNNTHAMLAGCSMGARLHRHSREEAQRCVLLQSSADFSAGQGCANVRGQSGGRTVRIRCRCS